MKKKGILTLLLVLVILAGLTFVVFNGLNLGFFTVDSVSDGVVLGLDLVGGSEITYEAVIPEGTDASTLTEGMNSAVTMLRQRLDSLGYNEANVYQSGETRIVVEIPNVSDPEEAVQKLGTTAVIQFRDADGTVCLTGSDVKSARYEYSPVDSTGLPVHHVVLSFTADGQKAFAACTKEIANRSGNDNYLEIVLDEDVISAPYVDKSKFAATGIDSDSAVITLGNDATEEEAKYLADLISAGQMPFSLECAKLQAVGATLGEKSLETSLLAGLIGMCLVAIFMIAVYRVMGVVSCVALTAYAVLFCLALSVFHVNLSLPGIAGIILTIGMAVDANVIIYERIKEELKAGKTLRAAIDTGYQHALSSIIDANITTIIAAVVLLIFGSGTIISFGKTLLIGVVLSMIVMLTLTKLLLVTAVSLKITNLKGYCV